MSHARYRPPNHSKGDESTIGGYAAVHDRPAAFEGSDGFSYSVEIMAEPTSGGDAWGAFFLFVKWSRVGAQTPEGHLESDYLAGGSTERDAPAPSGAGESRRSPSPALRLTAPVARRRRRRA